MLVAELPGGSGSCRRRTPQPDPTPFLQLTNIGSAGVQQGIYDIALDPNFATNHFFYVFYTLGLARTATACRASPRTHLHRHGRRAASWCCTRTREDGRRRAPRRRDHLRQRRQALLHHRRAVRTPPTSQSLTSPRGKIHRINMDGHDPHRQSLLRRAGAERGLDLGARACATRTAPTTTRPPAGCSSATSAATTTRRRTRRSNLGAAGANYGWPNCEGNCSAPLHEPALLVPAQRPGRRHHRRVRVPRHAVPERLSGQLLLRRLHAELDPAPDARRQRERHRRLQLRARRRVASTARTVTSSTSTEGPDGALYYVDIGYSRHQRHVRRQQDPPDPVRRSRTSRRSRPASAEPARRDRRR